MLNAYVPSHIQRAKELALKQNLMHTAPSSYLKANMGWDPIKDIGNALDDILSNFASAVQFIGESVINGLNHLAGEIGKILSRIDWSHIGRELLNLTKGAAHLFLVELNPINLIWQGLSTFPLTEHMARELDNLTGGAISSVHDISTLTGRAIRGDAISEEELIKDAMFAAKVASVVLTGGTATGIITASTGQMKKGTLGKTELGRAILDVASVAGIAYFAEKEVVEAATDEVIRQTSNASRNEVMKHSPLAETPMGRAFITTAFAATTSELIEGGSFVEAARGATKSATTSFIAEEAAKETGLPVTQGMVDSLENAGVPPDINKVDTSKLEPHISAVDFLNALNKINLRVDLSNIDITPGIKAINITNGSDSDKIDDAGKSFIESNKSIDWTKSTVQPVSVAGNKISLPNPGSEEGMEEIIKYWQIIKFLLSKRGCRALYARRYMQNGRYYIVYLLDDGTYYLEGQWGFFKSPLGLLLLGMAGVVLLVSATD